MAGSDLSSDFNRFVLMRTMRRSHLKGRDTIWPPLFLELNIARELQAARQLFVPDACFAGNAKAEL